MSSKPQAALSTKLGFAENFMLSGTAAAIAKTSAAPIERMKLLIQNQNELFKQGKLGRKFDGVGDCARRVLR
jgi:solute carrier family 25 (adenine nucleotide translocator) protein 4/5/6/31